MQTHIVDVSLELEVSDTSFDQSDTRTSTRLFKSEVCSAELKNASHLKNYIRTHSGEWPFKCEVCDAAFSQHVYLKTHVRTHTGKRPF